MSRTGSIPIVFVAAWAAWGQVPHQQHPPESAQEYARVLNDPSRDAWQKPDEVIAALGLKRTDSVADIGAGTGYFARRFAPLVSKVYAVDIDPALLKIAANGAPPNLITVLAAVDDPKLEPRSVDVIFFCNVLHHIENRAAYYPKLAAALRPGGRIVIVDFLKKPLPVGPPPGMKLTQEQVIQELRAAGFNLLRDHAGLPYQYFLEFQRSATAH